MPSGNISTITIGPNTTIWVGTDGGVAILDGTRSGYTVPVTSVADGTLPVSSMLRTTMYPNPVLNTSTLSITTSATMRVRATLFNSLGSVIAILMDQNVGPGDHTVRVDSRGIPAGMYFLRTEGDGRIQTLPVAIVR